MRVLISGDPYAPLKPRNGQWPCRWIACADAPAAPFVTAYRLKFSVEKPETVRVHVSADERYELFLDGARIGRGPERGDANNWFFETYDLDFSSGEHVLVARVWSLGEEESAGAPYAQMSVYPGFLFSPQDEQWIRVLGSGVAPWEAKVLGGYNFVKPVAAWGTGYNLKLDGNHFDWNFQLGEGDGWHPVEIKHPGYDPELSNDLERVHLMRPAMLLPQIDEMRNIGHVCVVRDIPADAPPADAYPSDTTHAIPILRADNIEAENDAWHKLLCGQGTAVVPPHTRRRVIVDLENYYCAYPEFVTTGGKDALVRVNWQESLFDDEKAKNKGNRDEVEGKFFVTIWHVRDGIGDLFKLDGGAQRQYETLWWQCGRFVEILVETQDEAVTLERFGFRETRYPLEKESGFDCDDERWLPVEKIMWRALQMCSHETYMDCPYYEQLQYVGDTRLQVLTTYTHSRDDRLPCKALYLFDESRIANGLTQSRYPSRVRQLTRGFALWWVAMVHDFAMWRDDTEFVAQRMTGVRVVLDGYRQFLTAENLIRLPFGPNFNFMDWVPGWQGGFPPHCGTGITALANWQWILVLRQAAQLEEWHGESEMAARWNRLADECEASTHKAFWSEERGLFADDLKHQHSCEHVQCLALLQNEYSHSLSVEQKNRIAQGLLNDEGLARTTIYFSHYLFETYRLLGRMDKFFERMELWFGLAAQGLKTTIEHPEPTRSDCHAWGAHPMYHSFASLLGIRPAAPGFSRVEIAPQLGTLQNARGTMIHPQGEICVDVSTHNDAMIAKIALPPNVCGEFVWKNQRVKLHGGAQEIAL
jgi:alpha-L-rhamnosidase